MWRPLGVHLRLWRAACTSAGGDVSHGVSNKPLKFACTGCGKCCELGASRRITVNRDEVAALERFTAQPRTAFVHETEGGSVLQTRDGKCVFLVGGRHCSVHSVRPVLCHSYPFWPELITPLGWLRASARCEGMRADEPVVPVDDVAAAAVLVDLSRAGQAGVYEDNKALLDEVPDEVRAHFREMQARSGETVRFEDDIVAVIDSCDEETGQTLRTLVLKVAPDQDQSVAVLDASGQLLPMHLVMPVHRALVLGVLMCPHPVRRVLCIGGGGCVIPLALCGPNTEVTVVELSQRVIDVARSFFLGAAPRGHDNVCLVCDDGAQFVADSHAQTFDFVILDAASSESSPAAELASASFLRSLRNCLTSNGVVAINCFGDGVADFEREFATVFSTAAAAALEVSAQDGLSSHTVVFGHVRADDSDGGAVVTEWRERLVEAAVTSPLDDSDSIRLAARKLRSLRSPLISRSMPS